ncbi:MAG: PASTA domain-containing protein [Casimicrobiaceae bacterium]
MALAAVANSAAASVFYAATVVAESGLGGFVSFGNGPSVNDKGKVAFIGRYSASTFTDEAVHLWTPIAGVVDISPGFHPQSRSFGESARINNNDEVAVWTRITPSNNYEVRVFRSGTPNQNSVMMRAATGGGASNFDLLYQNPAMNNTRSLEDRALGQPGNKDGVCNAGETCTSQLAFGAFNVNLSPTRYLVTVNKNPTDATDAGTQNSFGLNTAQSRPMMADDGRIVVRGVNATDPINLFNYALGAPTAIAGSANGFTALGAASGITSDGKVIAFAGNRGHGDGIFLSIQLASGTRRLVRIVGENATVPKSELGVDGSGNKLYLQSIELDSRVGVVYTPDVDGVANGSIVVSFIGTPNAASRTNPGTGKPFLFSAQKGLWTIRIDLSAPLFERVCVTRAPGSVLLPTLLGDDMVFAPSGAIPVIVAGTNNICETENDHASETLFSRSSPIPVVQIGDTIKSSTGLHTVSAISVHDPLAQANYDGALVARTARLGDHRVVYYAQVDAGAKQLIVRGDHLDSDQDGLLDHWETQGIDLEGTGTIDLDLPGMGANPFKRDLFLQVDWTADRPTPLNFGRTQRPVSGMVRMLAQAFAAAPALTNGIQAGIQLHVDAGTGRDAAMQSFSRNMGLGPVVGGQTVAGPPVDILYFGLTNSVNLPGVTAVDFDSVHNTLFWSHHRGAREFAFLHIVMSDHYSASAVNGGDDNVNPVAGTAIAVNDLYSLEDDGTGNAGSASMRNEEIKITAGTGAGQLRRISQVATNGVSGNKILTITPAWTVAPNATSKYTLFDASSGFGHALERYDGPFANGRNLAVTLSGVIFPGPNNETATLKDQFETFNHEMGHLLSLMHGGINHKNNYDPHYVSVMNYAYQLCPSGVMVPNGATCPISYYSGASDAVSNNWAHIDSRFAHTFQTMGQAFGNLEPSVASFPPPTEANFYDLVEVFGPRDLTPPVTVMAAPTGGAGFPLGATIPVTFSATDNVAVTRGEVYFDVNGDGVVADNEIFVPTFTPPGSFAITLPATSGPSGSRTLTVIAYDAMGNPGIVNTIVNIGSVANVTVPGVVGLTQDAATTSITGAGLAVGAVTTQTSGSVAAGSVISQNPAAAQSRSPGTAVALVISLGANGVLVPNFVGLTEGAALSAISAAGLVAAPVNHVQVPSAAGVIAQSPIARAIVTSGTTVYLQASVSGAGVLVPNVVGLTQAAATSAINAASLVVGTVTSQSSASVPAGNVISQNPLAGATVASGSAVDLVVSTGPAPVLVPNVVGLTQGAATTAITGANLVLGAVTTQSSATVPAGTVISQTPLAGSSVPPGSAVNVILSSGPAPGLVYKPLEPCRIMDTRSATFGSGVQGPIAGNTLYGIPGFITTGQNWAQYGGAAASDCGLTNPPGGSIHAVAIVATILNPNFDAYLGISDVNSLSTVLSNVALNYTHGQGLSTMYIVPQIVTNNIYFALPAGLSAQLIFDVVGYQVVDDATALQCTTQASAPVSIAGSGGSGSATSPACSASYTLTAGSCDSTSVMMSVAQDKATGASTTWFCAAINRGGTPANLTATATCCRVPGR